MSERVSEYEPFLDLPCSYKRRTEGPIPLGQTATTLLDAGNFSPILSRYPNKKPWDKPRVAPSK